jgi:hypothetical protein
MNPHGRLVALTSAARAPDSRCSTSRITRLVRILAVSDFAGSGGSHSGLPRRRWAARIAGRGNRTGGTGAREQVVRLTNGALDLLARRDPARTGADAPAAAQRLHGPGPVATAYARPPTCVRSVAAQPVALAAKAVLGPGTGLGVSGVSIDRGRWLALTGEGGHCSLAPADQRESAMLARAWRELEHVSGRAPAVRQRLAAAASSGRRGRRPPLRGPVDCRDRRACRLAKMFSAALQSTPSARCLAQSREILR